MIPVFTAFFQSRLKCWVCAPWIAHADSWMWSQWNVGLAVKCFINRRAHEWHISLRDLFFSGLLSSPLCLHRRCSDVFLSFFFLLTYFTGAAAAALWTSAELPLNSPHHLRPSRHIAASLHSSPSPLSSLFLFPRCHPLFFTLARGRSRLNQHKWILDDFLTLFLSLERTCAVKTHVVS